jgi:hypothetical protein
VRGAGFEGDVPAARVPGLCALPGGHVGPRVPGAEPLLGDPAHHPAGQQDTQDAPPQGQGERWRGGWGGVARFMERTCENP